MGVPSALKKLFTLTVAAVALAALSTTALAGSCGGCASGEKVKDKEKTQEGAQS